MRAFALCQRVTFHSQRPNAACSKRRGIAASKAVFCVPMILTIAILSIEICSGFFFKETLTVAAFEGARVGVQPRADVEDVVAQCNFVLEAKNISGADVDVLLPNKADDVAELSALDPVSVRITAPLDAYSLFSGNLLRGREVTVTVTMPRGIEPESVDALPRR